MTDPKPAPVCARCDDTHTVHLEDRSQMCTACPVPCSECRQGGNGPYCSTTPCACACHAKQVTPGDLKVAGKDVDAVNVYGEHAGADFVLAMRRRAALCRSAQRPAAAQVHAFIARQPDQSPVECSKCRKPSVLVDGEYRCPNNPECGV